MEAAGVVAGDVAVGILAAGVVAGLAAAVEAFVVVVAGGVTVDGVGRMAAAGFETGESVTVVGDVDALAGGTDAVAGDCDGDAVGCAGVAVSAGVVVWVGTFV